MDRKDRPAETPSPLHVHSVLMWCFTGTLMTPQYILNTCCRNVWRWRREGFSSAVLKYLTKAHRGKWIAKNNRRKKISITLSECVFLALGNQRAMRMRHIVVCSLSDSTIFFHFISQAAPFLNKVTEHKMCVLIFSTNFSETFLILRRIQCHIATHRRLHVQCAVILVIFQWNLISLDRLSQNLQLSDFLKIRPVGVELFHADRRTYMAKLVVAFRSSAVLRKGPKMFANIR